MKKAVIVISLLSSWYAVRSGTPIDTAYAAPIGGILQWVWMKGADRDAPVRLFLHGGPGTSVMGNARKFTGEREKSFVVVHWDQRDSGKSLKLNASAAPLTLELMVHDVLEMTDHLRDRFSKERIHLMGHSWGGFVALYVAALHPERLQACYAISPMVNQLESERRTLDWMILESKSTGSEDALDELASVEIPFATGEQLYKHRRWLAYSAGDKLPSMSFVLRWSDHWLPLFNEGSAVNLPELASSFDCPVFFILGDRDRQTDCRISQNYFQEVKAPYKDLLMLHSSGHNPHLDNPVKFQEWIKQTADKLPTGG